VALPGNGEGAKNCGGVPGFSHKVRSRVPGYKLGPVQGKSGTMRLLNVCELGDLFEAFNSTNDYGAY
jgi:hypothetical protein